MKRSIFFLLLFTGIVTLIMNGMDFTYHLTTDTSIHLKYVLVKFFIIATTIALTSRLVGYGLREGIFVSIAGPGMFYLYYVFAYPTIPREVFKIDENVGYILVHALALWIAYYLTYRVVMQRDGLDIDSRLAARIWASILGVFGLVFTFTPNTVLHDVGLQLELGAYGTSMLGLVSLMASIALFIWHRSDQPWTRHAAYSFLAAFGIGTVDLAFLMFTHIGTIEDFGTVFFTNPGYMWALLILVSTTTFLYRSFIGSGHLVLWVSSLTVGVQMALLVAYSNIAPFHIWHFLALISFVAGVQYLLDILWRYNETNY